MPVMQDATLLHSATSLNDLLEVQKLLADGSDCRAASCKVLTNITLESILSATLCQPCATSQSVVMPLVQTCCTPACVHETTAPGRGWDLSTLHSMKNMVPVSVPKTAM